MKVRMWMFSCFILLLALSILLLGVRGNGYDLGDSISTSSTIEFWTESHGNGEEELVIATYESLMAWGEAGINNDTLEITWDEVKAAVFDRFGTDHNVSVKIHYYRDAGDMLQALIQEKDSSPVDIVIGLDNTLAQEAINQELFRQYAPNVTAIPQWAQNTLDPSGYLTPYDYGVIALIQHKGDLNLGDNFTLQTIIDNGLANRLITQNPATSSTGLAFLLWTITVYEKILQQPWQDWWKEVGDEIRVTKGWSDSWTLWSEGEADLLVSYGTDPAYSNYFWGSTDIEAHLSHESGNPNGWVQVEGLGIMSGVDNSILPTAEAFIDWFISEEVQELVPTTNWMFPANQHVKLPEAFKYAIHPDNITVLNDYWTPEEIWQNLGSWRDTWEEIMVTESTPAFEWSIMFTLGIIVAFRRFRRKISV